MNQGNWSLSQGLSPRANRSTKAFSGQTQLDVYKIAVHKFMLCLKRNWGCVFIRSWSRYSVIIKKVLDSIFRIKLIAYILVRESIVMVKRQTSRYFTDVNVYRNRGYKKCSIYENDYGREKIIVSRLSGVYLFSVHLMWKTGFWNAACHVCVCACIYVCILTAQFWWIVTSMTSPHQHDSSFHGYYLSISPWLSLRPTSAPPCLGR
jgi:hypothetical protein